MTTRKAPDAFRTIGEVAAWLGVSAHVLRFWETKFPQIKPVKRAGGRRYYRPQDMALLGGLKQLLHEDGLTIRGAQKVLREKGVKAVAALSPPLDDTGEAGGAPPPQAPRPQAPPPQAPAAEAPTPETGAETATETDAETDAASALAGDLADRGFGADAETPTETPTEAPTGAPPEATAGDADLPPRAPLPGTPEGQMGLFADLPPLGDAGEQPPGAQPGREAEAEPDAERPGRPAPDMAREGAAPAPEIAPLPSAELPSADLPVAEALARLAPGQVPAAALGPLLARAEALRARMTAADSPPGG